jgi:hypothetical protein
LVHSGFEPPHLALLEASSDRAPEGPLRIAYVGTIITESSFHAAVAALNQARAGSSRHVQLEFFGKRNYRGSSWGLTVMDLEAEDARYSRFSFPNKVGTCLSAGVPVLGVGHEGSSLADAMRRHDIGRFSSATGPAALASFMAEPPRIAEPRARFIASVSSNARERNTTPKKSAGGYGRRGVPGPGRRPRLSAQA